LLLRFDAIAVLVEVPLLLCRRRRLVDLRDDRVHQVIFEFRQDALLPAGCSCRAAFLLNWRQGMVP